MSFLLRLVVKLPISTETRLAWQRMLLDSTYAKDISAARTLKDKEKIKSLEQAHRYEIDFHDEEEDAYVTKKLLAKARRLHVPVPHRYNDDMTESDYWYEGHYTGYWYLTPSGFSLLRDEIRREIKTRLEGRTQWFAWIPWLTGLIGSLTGLVALLIDKAP